MTLVKNPTLKNPQLIEKQNFKLVTNNNEKYNIEEIKNIQIYNKKVKIRVP